MSLRRKILEPIILTTQSFRQLWYEQKFSKEFTNTRMIYITNKVVKILPASIKDEEFIESQGVNRTFSINSGNPEDKNDRMLYLQDTESGGLLPCFICYDGNPTALDVNTHFVNSDISWVAYKFSKYILLKFLSESKRRDLLYLMAAWGAICLSVGIIITLMLT